MQLTNFVFTDKGDREFNEDYYDEITLEQGRCFVMADGCGAYGAGDLAAKMFCSAFLIEIKNNPLDDTNSEPEFTLHNLIEDAKEKMCDELKRVEHPEARTTCAIVWVDQDKMLTAHVGDTRIYRLSPQGRVWHTQDHTLAVEMQEVFYASIMIDTSARHTLLKSLGVDKPVDATVHGFEPLQKGETIVLCTDGFWKHVTSEEWRLLATTQTLDIVFQDIKKRFLSSETVCDNITAQVIRCL